MIESEGRAAAGVILKYRDRLQLPAEASPVTLGEGDTPLIVADRLAAEIGLPGTSTLFLKYEGTNPTGSFKDRGMSLAVTAAAFRGFRSVICASTGNTSASAAAYAARAGLACYVIIPQGRVAVGKLSQAIVHGARIVEIDGNFDAALTIVRDLGDADGCVVVNSVNPDRIEGQKTAAFEVCDVLGRAPDFHFLPVGNAGNITSYWRGYCEYAKHGITHQRPHMFGYQAAGAAPIVVGHPIPDPQTVATAIRIGNPASWPEAVRARDESGGIIDSVTDEEIMRAYRSLATTEGVFTEPASAASVAGLTKAVRESRIPSGAVVVCTLTGHGLKDPGAATTAPIATMHLPAHTDEVRRALWP